MHVCDSNFHLCKPLVFGPLHFPPSFKEAEWTENPWLVKIFLQMFLIADCKTLHNYVKSITIEEKCMIICRVFVPHVYRFFHKIVCLQRDFGISML